MNNNQGQKFASNSSSSGTPSANPLSVARERLQTSAREIFRSLEDAVRVPPHQEVQDAEKNNAGNRRLQPTLREGAASIEHALRVMFSSCTGANDIGTTPEEPLVALQQFQTIATPAKDSTVFNNITMVTPPTASTSSPHNSSNRRSSPSQRDMGEHIYAQLFHDDTGRAEQGIETSRRGTPEQDERHTPSPRALSKPFPISTPPRGFLAPSQELHVPASLTFDDAISCISAHTLEAMVDPPHSISRTIEHTSQKKISALPLSQPNSFVRVRSSGSNSRFSLPSKGNNSRQSKTTQTTESSGSSFEVWQAQEQKFWDDMVHQDGSTRHPHDTFSACFDENPFIQPVVREDINYLPGTFLEEEEFDFIHADMGEI